MSTHVRPSSSEHGTNETSRESIDEPARSAVDDESDRSKEQQLENQKLEEQNADARESLRRALRDLEAAEARVNRNAERVNEEARGTLVHELFPVLDNLDRAIEAAQVSSAPELLRGVRLVRKQLDDVLARYGAERIDAYDGSFDPSLQEAVTAETVTDPMQDHKVLKQLAPGYRFGDRLLRPARVVVGIYPS